VEAVDRVRAAGISAAAIFPRILSPLPGEELRFALEGAAARHVIVPEVNFQGQYAQLLKSRLFDVLRARPELQMHRLNIYGGLPFTAGEIENAIHRACVSTPVTA
jgi:2-oxoglutarate ferredoxin oxidoreductase subunit alpha